MKNNEIDEQLVEKSKTIADRKLTLSENKKLLIKNFSFNLFQINNKIGFFSEEVSKFFYIDSNGKLTSVALEAKSTHRDLFILKYFDGYNFYCKEYFTQVIKVFKDFKMTFSVKSIENTVSLGFPYLKKTLFNKGLLSKLNIAQIKLYDPSLNNESNPVRTIVKNLDTTKSNLLEVVLNNVLDMSNLLKLDSISNSIIISTRHAHNKTRLLSFFYNDITFNYPNFKGYNIPKDRKLYENDSARIIRTTKEYNNFNMDDIIIVKKVFINNKTPQRSNALCILKKDPSKQGLVFLSNLKKL